MRDRDRIPRAPQALIGPLWAHTSDEQKENRWQETLKWAQEYGFEELIPDLLPEEQYHGSRFGTWVSF